MRLLFITNTLTHHQLPFCEELYRRLGDRFTLLVTTAMTQERIRMGWGLDPSGLPYYIDFDTDCEGNGALVRDADVVICGGTHEMYIRERLGLGRLTFRYFERLYKKGRMRAFLPSSYFRKRKEHTKYRNAPVYLLCAGAYVPSDFSLLGAYPGKMLRFGYFPAFHEYTQEQRKRPHKERGNERLELLWTGRMIDWKYPEMAVEAAGQLAGKGVKFHLTMVGEGDHRKAAEELAVRLGVANEISFLPFEKPAQIRERMLSSDIYLLTSDHQEGWGAVVNEAMNAGCAVVACSAAGSVPYLIRHGENGLVFPDGKGREFGRQLYRVCSDDALRQRLGEAAYRTIAEEWNASVAAERFIAFSKEVLKGKARMDLFSEGPMSAAPKITTAKGDAYCRRDTKKEQGQ